jgi:hypothetical protein
MFNKRQQHFKFEYKGKVYAYVYIKKNACSAWKAVFSNESPYRDSFENGSNPIEIMAKHHRIRSVTELNNIENRILVVREPIERLVSGYLNQFILRFDRKSELHNSITEITGFDIKDITFYQFINHYLLSNSEDIDGHFWSQSSHLVDVDYNIKININSLYDDTKIYFGEEFANKYFKKKVNSTKKIKKYDDNVTNVKAIDIYNRYKYTGEIPSVNALMNDELEKIIKDVYSDDYTLKNTI